MHIFETSDSKSASKTTLIAINLCFHNHFNGDSLYVQNHCFKFTTAMKKNSHALRKLMSRASRSQWFEDEDSEDEINWNETLAERSVRISKKKAEKAKQEQDAKEQHLITSEFCFVLVHELFVSEVFRIATFREASRKARIDAAEFAKSAALKRFSGGIVWNQNQNVCGGPLAIPWKEQDLPRPKDESDKVVVSNSIRKAQDTNLPFSRAHGGDWIETVCR
jgi:hypothetical protein